MSKLQRISQLSIFLILALLCLPVFTFAEVIPIPGLSNILQSLIDTIREYVYAIDALVFVFFGVRSLMDLSNANKRTQFYEAMAVLVGANILIFGAEAITSWLTGILKK